MPKRKAENKIKEYKQKIKKLQEKHRTRRRIIISDSESDIENQDVHTPENYKYPNEYCDILPPLSPEIPLPNTSAICNLPYLEDNSNINMDSADPIPIEEQNNVINENSLELDPDIRLALGDPIEDIPKYGANIHNDLAQCWLPILKRGLTKDVKDSILKEHHVPDNCRLLKSPSLNPEIAAAVTEVVRIRDKKMESKQNQLGLGITAISRAMEVILKDGSKLESVKLLSDGCRLLTDLHYIETQIRSKCITPCLDRSILSIIYEEERDELLFGNQLSEKLKAAKAIEKQSWQMKRNVPQKHNNIISQSKVRLSGNWTPLPRYLSPMNRGGRTVHMARGHMNRLFRPQAPPLLPPSASMQSQTRAAAKYRAQTRQ